MITIYIENRKKTPLDKWWFNNLKKVGMINKLKSRLKRLKKKPLKNNTGNQLKSKIKMIYKDKKKNFRKKF